MNRTGISLKKLNGISIHVEANDNKDIACTINAEMMRLGFVMSSDLFRAVASLHGSDAIRLANNIIAALKQLKGADVEYIPMYPNFPRQVMETPNIELYLNAIMHYWTLGEWKPEYQKLPREFALEIVKFREIGLVTDADFSKLFTTLLSSNDSLSAYDKSVVEWFLANRSDLEYPETIPYKETLCLVAGHLLNKGKDISDLVKSATDILRICTYLSDGDVSLAENTKFKSLPRRHRRALVNVLHDVISEEDIQRHRNKWNKLFHNLHVGEYSAKVRDIATKVRENIKLESLNGKIQDSFDRGDVLRASALLMRRPGEYARKLDHLLRLDHSKVRPIINNFFSIADKVSTRVLAQVLGHMKARGDFDSDIRVVFPKGRVQKAQAIPVASKKIPAIATEQVVTGISEKLVNRFSALEPLGNVFVDERLKRCPLPAQQRSSSEGLDIVARGTRLPIGDKNTLRLFIYWIGRDIDLSATLHDADFKELGHISYTNLKETWINACHSGDITQAANGASEFIDIDLSKANACGVRYVVMNVLVYSGPNFNEHEKCYAGWMTRNAPNSNEIYDPKTVTNKVDLAAESKNAIPVIFDLETREAVWCDLATSRSGHYGGNNVESNKATIEQVLQSMISIDNKMTLHDLFTLHGIGRGVRVPTKEEADTVFSLDEGITPRDINIINSEYLV